MAWNDWPEVRSVRNRREGFRFALQPAAGLCALTMAAAQLQNDHGYVVLGNSAHSLTHPGGIDRAEGGDQLDAAPMQIGDYVLLDHQIACQLVQLRDDDGLNLIAVDEPHQPLQTGRSRLLDRYDGLLI